MLAPRAVLLLIVTALAPIGRLTAQQLVRLHLRTVDSVPRFGANPLGFVPRVADSAVAGMLIARRNDTLFLALANLKEPLPVPFHAVLWAEVRERQSAAATGALIGVALGLAVGIYGATRIDGSCDPHFWVSCSDLRELDDMARGFTIAGGVLAGTGLGAVIGAFVHLPRWRGVPVQALP